MTLNLKVKISSHSSNFIWGLLVGFSVFWNQYHPYTIFYCLVTVFSAICKVQWPLTLNLKVKISSQSSNFILGLLVGFSVFWNQYHPCTIFYCQVTVFSAIKKVNDLWPLEKYFTHPLPHLTFFGNCWHPYLLNSVEKPFHRIFHRWTLF